MAIIVLKGINDSYYFDSSNPNNKLGEGGMGIVYKATTIDNRNFVAVKAIHPTIAASFDIVERAKREAAIQIKHKNIVRNLEFIEINNEYYIISEFIEGLTLRQYLNNQNGKRISEDNAIRIISQALDGLSCLHKNNIIHRDIDPSNIMINTNSTVKITDFGIAKKLDSKDTTLTGTGHFIGKLQYASPEQIKGDKSMVDARSDIYSIGIVLYELLAGSRPFDSKNIFELMILHLKEPLPPNKYISERLFKIIQKATSKKIEDRFHNVEIFKFELIKNIPLNIPLSSAQEFYNRAQEKVKKFNYEEAIKDYTEAIILDNSNALYYIERAKIFLKIGKNDSAIGDYSKAIELSPKNGALYNHRGLCYKNSDIPRFDLAISDFWKAYKLSQLKEYFENWINSVVKAKKIEMLDQYLETHFRYKDLVYFERGLLLLNKFRKKNYKRALEDILKAHEINPAKGYLKIIISNNAQNLKLLNDYINMDLPMNDLAFFERGKIFLNQNDYKNAFIDFINANELNTKMHELKILIHDSSKNILFLNEYIYSSLPLKDLALFERGMIFFNKKKFDKAAEDFYNAYKLSNKTIYLDKWLTLSENNKSFLDYYFKYDLPQKGEVALKVARNYFTVEKNISKGFKYLKISAKFNNIAKIIILQFILNIVFRVTVYITFIVNSSEIFNISSPFLYEDFSHIQNLTFGGLIGIILMGFHPLVGKNLYMILPRLMSFLKYIDLILSFTFALVLSIIVNQLIGFGALFFVMVAEILLLIRIANYHTTYLQIY